MPNKLFDYRDEVCGYPTVKRGKRERERERERGGGERVRERERNYIKVTT